MLLELAGMLLELSGLSSTRARTSGFGDGQRRRRGREATATRFG